MQKLLLNILSILVGGLYFFAAALHPNYWLSNRNLFLQVYALLDYAFVAYGIGVLLSFIVLTKLLKIELRFPLLQLAPISAIIIFSLLVFLYSNSGQLNPTQTLLCTTAIALYMLAVHSVRLKQVFIKQAVIILAAIITCFAVLPIHHMFIDALSPKLRDDYAQLLYGTDYSEAKDTIMSCPNFTENYGTVTNLAIRPEAYNMLNKVHNHYQFAFYYTTATSKGTVGISNRSYSAGSSQRDVWAFDSQQTPYSGSNRFMCTVTIN